MSVASLFIEWGGWSWFILAAILVTFDIAAPGLFLLWFGVAAAGTGLAVFAAPIPWPWQVALFCVLSVAALVAGRTLFSPAKIRTNQPLLNQRAAQLVGQVFVLEEPILAGRGKVKSGDVIWNVSGPDLNAGARVIVTGADGSRLIVEEHKTPDLPKASTFGA
ncbi:MAG: NfeD family protein [Hyphomicrobiales bacterium]|nr:NfeD family protein [Hyphomicrobiales bacterium]